MPVTQKLACVVERIVDHGDRVYTVLLRPERPVPRFRAGQFLHLSLDSYDPSSFWPESRVFSIASSPAQRDSVQITYAVHGAFTRRMEIDLAKGRRVWIKMPYGDFVVSDQVDVALFAGGTGITAFTAFLQSLTPATNRTVTLAYGARTSPLLIYRDVVERCAQRLPSLHIFYFVEDDGTGEPSTVERWPPWHRGRVSVADVWPLLPRPLETAYYIAGPPPMLHAIGRDLRARKIPPEEIHIDAWE